MTFLESKVEMSAYNIRSRDGLPNDEVLNRNLKFHFDQNGWILEFTRNGVLTYLDSGFDFEDYVFPSFGTIDGTYSRVSTLINICDRWPWKCILY